MYTTIIVVQFNITIRANNHHQEVSYDWDLESQIPQAEQVPYLVLDLNNHAKLLAALFVVH